MAAERNDDAMAQPHSASGPDGAAAFDALVAAHYARLCNFVYRYVGSRATAEDVVQDVFAKIWERGDDLEYRDPVQYLYRAARNRAISYIRHERVHDRMHVKIVADGLQSPPPPLPNADLEREELSAAITRAIAELPERCRLVYTMSRDQAMTYAEIARVLGISVKTVEVQMYRAFKNLRRKVAPFLVLLAAVRAIAL